MAQHFVVFKSRVAHRSEHILERAESEYRSRYWHTPRTPCSTPILRTPKTNAKAKASIEALDKSVAEETRQRKEAHAALVKRLAENHAALELLHTAKKRLQRVYRSFIQQPLAVLSWGWASKGACGPRAAPE